MVLSYIMALLNTGRMKGEAAQDNVIGELNFALSFPFPPRTGGPGRAGVPSTLGYGPRPIYGLPASEGVPSTLGYGPRPTEAEVLKYHIPTPEEEGKYKEGVKNLLGKGKKKAKEQEIAGLKEYVDKALAELREKVERPTAGQEIYDGSIETRNLGCEIEKVGAEIGALRAAYESDIANITTTDTDLGKVEISRYDPTKSGTLKSAAGAEFDEIQNNAKARIPGMREEYETYKRDLETVRITAGTLITSLLETDSVLRRERDRYATSLCGYEKATDDAKRQSENLGNIPGVNQKYLEQFLDGELKSANELRKRYAEVVSHIDTKRDTLSQYTSSAEKLVNAVNSAIRRVSDRIGYIDGTVEATTVEATVELIRREIKESTE